MMRKKFWKKHPREKKFGKNDENKLGETMETKISGEKMGTKIGGLPPRIPIPRYPPPPWEILVKI